jgi:hypothetical protein
MPAVMVGVMIWRAPPLPQTLATAPVTRRSTLATFRLLPRSTTRREFCRTRNDALPITKTRLAPGPVSTRSPVSTV